MRNKTKRGGSLLFDLLFGLSIFGVVVCIGVGGFRCGVDTIQKEAAKNGHGEFYRNAKQEMTFRWKEMNPPPPPTHFFIPNPVFIFSDTNPTNHWTNTPVIFTDRLK